jgi:pyrroline-5-carboxylate reductase
VKALEEHAFRGAVMDCVAAAYAKTLDLGKGK